jgi:hypothetical protein
MAFIPWFALLQNGAYSMICLATKWRLFHDFPCYKMVLIPWFALLQNDAYSTIYQHGSHLDGFSWNFLLGPLRKNIVSTDLVEIWQKHRALHEGPSVFDISSDIMWSNNTENALLCWHGNAFSIYYIVDSDICTSTIQRERIFAFPCQQWLR